MRLPWKRRNEGHDVQTVTAAEALEISRRKLEEAQSDWPEVSGVTYLMKEHRTRNHFAERIEQSYRERRT